MIYNLLLSLGIILANGSNLNKTTEIKELKPKNAETNISYDIGAQTNVEEEENQPYYRRVLSYLKVNDQTESNFLDGITFNGINMSGSYWYAYVSDGYRVTYQEAYYIELSLNAESQIKNNKVNLNNMARLRVNQSSVDNYLEASAYGVDITEMRTYLYSDQYELEEKIDTLTSIGNTNLTHTLLETESYTSNQLTPQQDLYTVNTSNEITLNGNKRAFVFYTIQKFEIAMGNGDTGSNTEIVFTNIIPDTTIEVIDLPGLMFTILGMPFSFISQAFNLTLFPNTPYSINVSNLLFAIITGLLIIIILRKLLK